VDFAQRLPTRRGEFSVGIDGCACHHVLTTLSIISRDREWEWGMGWGGEVVESLLVGIRMALRHTPQGSDSR
jgi:hypothetical protein